ncbi:MULTISPECIES: PAS domain S-box protein [Marinobacter]|uniref:PAS domain S-box protein n=1 Tax=Marinobacter TaxID=2742 RepID=UPI001247C91F|nr:MULTISPECIES: PAS domain S-box protein [Marinobacter]MBL3556239.1 PAS domain S-box protein [Marinobacter sp. JB05H06]
MSHTNGYSDVEHHERLRRSASDLIEHGVPPRNHGGNLSVEALHLLYERASNPESAADALKLLHELQTYQVELDLLYEQLLANEQEINEELAHYRSLYEQAPAAYLIVANDGDIIEGNLAAGILFGDHTTDLAGMGLNALLAPGQHDIVNTLLRTSGAVEATVELQDRRCMVISAKPTAARDSVLMILTEATTYAPTY